jgi:hypothetical protein
VSGGTLPTGTQITLAVSARPPPRHNLLTTPAHRRKGPRIPADPTPAPERADHLTGFAVRYRVEQLACATALRQLPRTFGETTSAIAARQAVEHRNRQVTDAFTAQTDTLARELSAAGEDLGALVAVLPPYRAPHPRHVAVPPGPTPQTTSTPRPTGNAPAAAARRK